MEEKFNEGKLFSKMLDKELGLRPNYWPPEVWIENIVEKLLHCEEDIEYSINDFAVVKSGVHDWDEVLFYLEKIELIKHTSEYFSIDPRDRENDEKLHQFVLNRAPDIEIIDAHTFVVTNSPFYKALNAGQKALFFLSNSDSTKYPYHDIKIPDKYKTREFFDYMDVYYDNSWGPSYFTLTEKGSRMLLKINGLISKLCNYVNNISLEEVIEQLKESIPMEMNDVRTKAVAFTKKEKE